MTALLEQPAQRVADDTPMCARGVHPKTPDNLGQKNRCRPCHNEYSRARRAGLAWVGPGRGCHRGTAPSYRPDRVVPADQLRRMREQVGACLACGWTPDIGWHRCTVGVGSPNEVGPPPSD